MLQCNSKVGRGSFIPMILYGRLSAHSPLQRRLTTQRGRRRLLGVSTSQSVVAQTFHHHHVHTCRAAHSPWWARMSMHRVGGSLQEASADCLRLADYVVALCAHLSMASVMSCIASSVASFKFISQSFCFQNLSSAAKRRGAREGVVLAHLARGLRRYWLSLMQHLTVYGNIILTSAQPLTRLTFQVAA